MVSTTFATQHWTFIRDQSYIKVKRSTYNFGVVTIVGFRVLGTLFGGTSVCGFAEPALVYTFDGFNDLCHTTLAVCQSRLAHESWEAQLTISVSSQSLASVFSVPSSVVQVSADLQSPPLSTHFTVSITSGTQHFGVVRRVACIKGKGSSYDIRTSTVIRIGVLSA